LSVGTGVTDASLDIIRRDLPGLKQLGVGGSQVTMEGLLRFHDALPSCYVVHISKPGAEILLNEVQKSLGLVITDAHIARLVPKETTTRLMASSLAIGDRAMEHIGTCQNLKYLELDGTNVTDAGLLRISGLRKLENLRLDNDNITD